MTQKNRAESMQLLELKWKETVWCYGHKNGEDKTACPHPAVTDTQNGPKRFYFRLHEENVQE